MSDIMDWALAFTRENLAWAGPAMGLLALCEGTAFVGIVVPATPFLFMFGLMLGSGQISPWSVIPYALAGTVLGAQISYEVGLRCNRPLLRSRRLKPWRRNLARLYLYFRRFGGVSLIIGRLVLGPFQSTLPLIAGIARMRRREFFGYTVASALLWVVVVLAPGYLTGCGMLTVLTPYQLKMASSALIVLSLGVSVGGVMISLRRLSSAVARGK